MLSENGDMIRHISLSASIVGAIAVASAAQFPADLFPDDLDGRSGFTVYGYRTNEFGWTAAGVGDVNADGIDDFASGGWGVLFDIHCAWPQTCQDCVVTAGAVNVIFGRPGIGGDGAQNLEDADETQTLRVVGVNPEDQAMNVSAAGDFNNDGFDDLLVGAGSASPFGLTSAGEAYMIYGGPELANMGTLQLSSLDAPNGFTMRGHFSLGGVGRHMAVIGDFDGDGVDDVALGITGADPQGRPNAGVVALLFGGRGLGDDGAILLPAGLDATTGIIFNGGLPGDAAGVVVDSAGDFNGDGLDDLLISALGADPHPNAIGQVYVIYGGLMADNAGEFELSELDGINGFAINGPSGPAPPGPRIGQYAAGVGDINADGFDDIAVGVDDTSNNWATVVFGGPNVAPDAVFCLEDLNGENGFMMPFAGHKVARTGDLNHDGIHDLMVNSVVYFGSPDIGSGGIIYFNEVHDGQHAMWFRAQLTRGRSSAGDINDDGIDDILFGFPHFDDYCDVGKVHVLFGRRMGDGDLDADIDFADFGGFQGCFGQPADGDVPDECHPFDFDKDNDVDLTDYAAFQIAFGTPP